MNWQPHTIVPIGAQIDIDDRWIARCVGHYAGEGITGATEPDWAFDTTVIDRGVIWRTYEIIQRRVPW